MTKTKKYYQGAVSLFMVVFTTLLLSILVLSFIKIMVKDQQRASRSDLSQSAYDSALAGVEDAKRAVTKYMKDCVYNSTGANCTELAGYLNGDSCDAASKLLTGTSGEQKIGGDNDDYMSQAYTCVKIQYQTPDYVGKLDNLSDSVIIPINAVSKVSSVKISWFAADDLPSSNDKTVDLVNYDPSKGFWTSDRSNVGDSNYGHWPANRPPALVVQYYRIDGADFTVDKFNRGAEGGLFKTAFLAPSGVGDNQGFFKDSRSGSAAAPIHPVKCQTDLGNAIHACQYDIKLPETILPQRDQVFIRLSKRYSSRATFKVELKNDEKIVNFDGVQPIVDSNGRADNLFRRVEARIQPLGKGGSQSLPMPLGAVQIERGDFCKDFSVSDQPTDTVFNCD